MFSNVVGFLTFGLRSILNLFVHSIHSTPFRLLGNGLSSTFHNNYPGVKDDPTTFHERAFCDQLKQIDSAIEEGRELINKTPCDETDPVLVVDALFFNMNQALLVEKRKRLQDLYASVADGSDMTELAEYYNDQHRLVMYCVVVVVN